MTLLIFPFNKDTKSSSLVTILPTSDYNLFIENSVVPIKQNNIVLCCYLSRLVPQQFYWFNHLDLKFIILFKSVGG